MQLDLQEKKFNLPSKEPNLAMEWCMQIQRQLVCTLKQRLWYKLPISIKGFMFKKHVTPEHTHQNEVPW